VEIERGDPDAPRHAPDRPDPAGREERTAADAGEVLADPERRLAEHQRYRTLVDRAYGAARDQWGEAVPELRGAWEKIKEKYGYEERRGPTPQPDDGAWHGEGGRRLDAAQNEEIDRGYAGIRETGEKTIIPGIVSVAAEDPTRHLAGFDKRFKGEDRLKEKVADLLEPSPNLSAGEALDAVSDAVRFTYTYSETRYAQGVSDDIERLKARGFELDKLKNTWASDQYKGINTQWLEPGTGVRFEVQFHTQASLDAKELSHKAYERIRSIADPSPDTDRESAELEGFQSSVNAAVPIPPDVSAIEDYRREKRDG
jgi:hypothetical protein